MPNLKGKRRRELKKLTKSSRPTAWTKKLKFYTLDFKIPSTTSGNFKPKMNSSTK